ncbi:MAG: phosphoglycerate mutase, partial [Planctomycetales bacterium]|nr:phosphoglycerate mutase [Planctomycetales bacterium]
DTDYAAKGQAALDALGRDDIDVVCVHIEAPDEASHEGRADAKIEALERIDSEIVGPLWAEAQRRGDTRVLVSPDHPTPIRLKTHSHGMVPFVLAGSGVESGKFASYDEAVADASPHVFAEGWKLMQRVLG